MSCSVVLRDGSAGSSDLRVNVAVLHELGLLSGDFVELCSSSSSSVSLLARVVAGELPRGVAECGRALAVQGVEPGETLLLRALAAPLVQASRVRVRCARVDDDRVAAAALGADDGPRLARAWRGLPVWAGAVMLASLHGRTVPVLIQDVQPGERGLVGPDTRVLVAESDRELVREAKGPARALSIVEQRLARAVASAHSGAEGAPHGMVLWGPPGSGKTWTVKQMFGSQLVEAGASLLDSINQAKQLQPSVLLIDEADKRLSAQEGGSDGAEGAVHLMSILDRLEGVRVAVIVVVRRPDVLPMALRRPGRLEIELELGQMSGAERRSLLKSLLAEGGAGDAVVVEELEMPGMVAGDVAAVAREVLMLDKNARQDAKQVIAASKRVQTGAARGWEVEVPKAGLEEVKGMREAKQRLAECIEWPLLHADAFARLGVKPASGILLYGPPGNGKTLLARGAASQMNCSFILVKGPELYSKYVGESERALAAVFAQARRQHPCLVFLDEIDALAPRRASSGAGGGQVSERMLGVLLAQLDGVSPLRGVTVVGATNRPDQLDPALLRPGRLSHLLYVALPDANARSELLLAAMRGAPLAPNLTEDGISDFASRECEGCSGAECAAIAREAKMMALARATSGLPAQVSLSDLEEARKSCPPRTSAETIRFYENWKIE